MGYLAQKWYVNSVSYSSVAAWSSNTAISAGALRKQTSPTAGNERVFVAIVGGTTHATTEPTWSVTRGAKTTDNTVTWQEVTGQPGVNGDVTSQPSWTSAKNAVISLGVTIKDVAGTHLFICSTAGTAGNGAEPTWNTAAAGNTTADNTVTWTYIGLASSFSALSAPHARLYNSLVTNWRAPGDTIYVGDNHSETLTAATFIMNGSAVADVTATTSILCHNHAGNFPPQSSDLTTGANINATSSAFCAWNMVNIYVQGLTITHTGTYGGSGAFFGNANGARQYFKNCSYVKSTSAGGGGVCPMIGSNTTERNSKVIWDNVTLTCNSVGDYIQVSDADFEWKNTASPLAGTAPTSGLLKMYGGRAHLIGLDLTAVASTNPMMGSATDQGGQVWLDECDLATTNILTAGSVGNALVVNNSGEVHTNQGTLVNDTTVVRTGGQGVSGKITTSAYTSWAFPFEWPSPMSGPLAVGNTTVGSPITVTLYGIWGGGSVPNNDDFWIEIDYDGPSGLPKYDYATATKSDILAANAALSSDPASPVQWSGSTTPFKVELTVTPSAAGDIHIRVFAAKPSTTFYFDPYPLVF